MSSRDYFRKVYRSDAEDPWGMRRASQIRRKTEYLKNLKDFFGTRIFTRGIDLACGDGNITKEISNMVERMDIADAFKEMLSIAKKTVDSRVLGSVFNYELPALPVQEEYDIIFALEVLYYLSDENRKNAISNIRELMTKSSWLILTLSLKDYNNTNTFMKAVKVYPRYKEFLGFTDKAYKLAWKLDILQKAILVGVFDSKNMIMTRLVKIRYLLIPLVLIIVPIKLVCTYICRSVRIESFFYSIGKLIGLQHERHMFFLQLR